MPTKTDILLGIVLPAVFSGLLFVIAWRPWNRTSTADGRWAGPVTLGGAFVWAYWRLAGISGFPLQSQSQWIVYAMIAAVGFGVVDALVRPPLWIRLPIVLAVMAATIWLLICKLVPGSFTPAQARLWTAALAVASSLWWLSMETLAERAPGVTMPFVLLPFAVGCAAVTAMVDGVVTQPMVAGAVAAALGMAAAVALWSRGRFSLVRGGVFAAAVALLGLLIFGFFWAPDDPTPKTMAAHAMLFLAPLLAWIGFVPGVRRLPPVVRTTIGVLAVLAVVGVAVGLAASVKPPNSTETSEYNY